MTKTDGKPCVRCGTNEWSKWGGCYECKRVASRIYRQEHKDKARETRRKWAIRNKEKDNAYKKKWAVENRLKINKKSGEYRKNNPEIVKKRNSSWWKRNKSKSKAYSNKRRAARAEAGGGFTDYEWNQLVKEQSNRCLACGKNKKLTADHVIPLSKGGSSNIDNIQGLCKSCNSSKGAKTIDYRKNKKPERWVQNKLF